MMVDDILHTPKEYYSLIDLWVILCTKLPFCKATQQLHISLFGRWFCERMGGGKVLHIAPSTKVWFVVASMVRHLVSGWSPKRQGLQKAIKRLCVVCQLLCAINHHILQVTVGVIYLCHGSMVLWSMVPTSMVPECIISQLLVAHCDADIVIV